MFMHRILTHADYELVQTWAPLLYCLVLATISNSAWFNLSVVAVSSASTSLLSSVPSRRAPRANAAVTRCSV